MWTGSVSVTRLNRWGQDWPLARGCLAAGFELLARQPGALLSVAALYALPALVSAAMVLLGWTEAWWQVALVVGLPWITLAVAPAVFMVAVAAGFEGKPLGPKRATVAGLRALPRYLLTNLHTTPIFWLPTFALELLWQAVGGPAAVWVGLLGAVAVHQHVRTTLAPYGAVHGRTHPTRATWYSWQLGGRHFGTVLTILTLGTLPLGVPVLGAYTAVRLLGSTEVVAVLDAVATQSLAVLLQAVRPTLIPALFRLYETVWPER